MNARLILLFLLLSTGMSVSAQRLAYQPDSARMQKNDDLVAFNGYRASPRVTDKLIKKRNIGIGLTISGVAMVGVGAVMYSVIPKQSIVNSGGNQYLAPSAGSIAGVLFMVAGVGITIPGVIVWGVSAHKIHRAEREKVE